MNLDRKIISIANDLDLDFWDSWREYTGDFPDMDEGWDAQLLVLQVSISCIILKYLMGFDSKFRAEKLEDMISDLRKMEVSLRDKE